MKGSHPTIGAKIKQLRRDRGWDLRKLGAQAGIHFSQIGKWERRESDPSWAQTCKLAKAFGIPPRLLWDPDPLTVNEEPPQQVVH